MCMHMSVRREAGVYFRHLKGELIADLFSYCFDLCLLICICGGDNSTSTLLQQHVGRVTLPTNFRDTVVSLDVTNHVLTFFRECIELSYVPMCARNYRTSTQVSERKSLPSPWRVL